MAKNIVQIIREYGLEYLGRHYGFYTGFVKNNIDPENRDRVLVYIPQVHLSFTQGYWAEPKNQFAGNNYGSHIMPSIGDMVYVEFSFGDVKFPFWSHGGFGNNEKPSEFYSPNVYGFKSPKGNLLAIDDDMGDIVISQDYKNIVRFKLGDEEEGTEDYISIDQNGNIINLYNGTDGDDIGYIEILQKDGRKVKFTEEVIQFDGGENFGLVKVKELTEKINNLENTVNSLIAKHNSHIHITTATVAATPTPGIIAPTSTTETGTLTATQQPDIENEKVTH